MKRGYESGYCTGLRCRRYLQPGQGNQVLRARGKIDRYCERCWKRECDALDVQSRVIVGYSPDTKVATIASGGDRERHVEAPSVEVPVHDVRPDAPLA